MPTKSFGDPTVFGGRKPDSKLVDYRRETFTSHSERLTVLMDAAKDFAEAHVGQGAVEICIFKKTGILAQDGAVRRLATFLQQLGMASGTLQLAETLFTAAAVEEIAAQHLQDPRNG